MPSTPSTGCAAARMMRLTCNLSRPISATEHACHGLHDQAGGRFPDFHRVIHDTSTAGTAIVNKSDFAAAIKRMTIVAYPKNNGVKIEFIQDQMRFETDNPGHNAGQDEILAESSGEDKTIGFNAKYMMDVIKAFSRGTLVWKVKDERIPTLITDPDDESYFSVLMPMQV